MKCSDHLKMIQLISYSEPSKLSYEEKLNRLGLTIIGCLVFPLVLNIPAKRYVTHSLLKLKTFLVANIHI